MCFTGTCVVDGTVEVLCKSVSVEHVGDIGRTRPAQVVRIRDACLTLLSFFGRNQDNTERSTRTVDGSRSRIHQYRDVVDVLRVQLVQVACYTVNQHERRSAGTCSQVTCTADVERRIGIQFTTGIRYAYIQARNDTLQSLTYRRYRTRFQFLVVYRSHGPGQVHFLLCTETYYYHFIKCLSIFRQSYLIRSLSFLYGDFLGLITDVGNYQCTS